MSTAYSKLQYESNYPPGVEFHWWNLARNRIVSTIVKEENSAQAVFLDVGCGKGLEVKELRDAGIEAFGVELAEVSPLEAVRQFVHSGIDAVHLPLEQRNRVTGILLLDVIEHLPEPVVFLNALQQNFPNLSVVVVTVPACQELWSNYDIFYGHYRRYSTEMLQHLADELGWVTAGLGYFFHLLYMPGRLLALFGIDRQTEFKTPATRWRWLHKLIAYINRLDKLILPSRVKGSSAFAVYHVNTG